MTDQIDIFGIGNAIVDVIAQTSPGFLEQWAMTPGSMALIDADRAHRLTAALASFAPTRSSGGSAANTCVVASRLGARVAYLGKVADDALGADFARGLADAGVAFSPGSFIAGAPTGRCLIAVTPDGQRTMNTFLGAATALSAADIDEQRIAAASIVYLEGYLFDPPSAQAAFRKAADVGRRVALTLSDPFCVDRHRAAFRDFIGEHADIVFGNEAEYRSLFEDDDLESCAGRLAREVELAVITRSGDGSIIVSGERRVQVPAEPTRVVDTTGAGDAYAAGFLAALARGETLEAAGRIASIVAAEIISHVGARPEADLITLVQERR